MRAIANGVIAAIGTPLADDESLDVRGLEAHIDDQFSHGMTGLLVAGTMGLMQLLADATYRELVSKSIEITAGRGEVLVGAGDASFARTRDRIQFLNDKKIDGVVVLAPFLIRFSQDELLHYFNSLADYSKHKLYLYDLPGLTGTKLELSTILKLADHPNIGGIKCSGELAGSRHLVDIAPLGFRVIIANAELMDLTLQSGVLEHLDGMFALAPGWIRALVDSVLAADWPAARHWQKNITLLLNVLRAHGIFQSFSTILNARGIGGRFMSSQMRVPSIDEQTSILEVDIVRELLKRAAPTAP